LIFYFELSTF